MWLVKYRSPLRAKLMALLFPFGTWLIMIVCFHAGGRALKPVIGHAFELPFSLLQLAGFLTILVANILFILKRGPSVIKSVRGLSRGMARAFNRSSSTTTVWRGEGRV